MASPNFPFFWCIPIWDGFVLLETTLIPSDLRFLGPSVIGTHGCWQTLASAKQMPNQIALSALLPLARVTSVKYLNILWVTQRLSSHIEGHVSLKIYLKGKKVLKNKVDGAELWQSCFTVFPSSQLSFLSHPHFTPDVSLTQKSKNQESLIS